MSGIDEDLPRHSATRGLPPTDDTVLLLRTPSEVEGWRETVRRAGEGAG